MTYTDSSEKVPLGKAVIPFKMLKSGTEEWYPLMSASLEGKVTGSITVQLRASPVISPDPVTSMSSRSSGIEGNEVNLKIRMQNAQSMGVSKDRKDNVFCIYTIFSETTALPVGDAVRVPIDGSTTKDMDVVFSKMEGENRELHCSFWCEALEDEKNPPTFLGHFFIPLADVIANKAFSNHVTLSGLNNDAGISEIHYRCKLNNIPLSNMPQQLIKYLQSPENKVDFTPTLHKFKEKLVKVNDCDYCDKKIFGTELTCSNCLTTIHQECLPSFKKKCNKSGVSHNFSSKQAQLTKCPQCSEFIQDDTEQHCTECGKSVHQKCLKEMNSHSCGSKGAIRLRLYSVKFAALDLVNYFNLIMILKADNFILLRILGKVSPLREEAARCLIRIFNNSYVDFLAALLRSEIMEAPNTATLFRANSMASKALDVFMKNQGTEYLCETLQDILLSLIRMTDKFELDPTRVSETSIDYKETHSNNLIKMNEIVANAIFSSAEKMPQSLQLLFATIQSTVRERFPEDETVVYTAVSGFIFLRFFTPAILGPSLFGLKVGFLNDENKRKLTLIAKTLQNLSNLAEFGGKEPYMAPINTFIQEKIPDLKVFIDTISQPLFYIGNPVNYPTVDTEKDCAELVVILLSSIEKLSNFDPPCDLVPKLLPILTSIDQKGNGARSEFLDVEGKPVNVKGLVIKIRDGSHQGTSMVRSPLPMSATSPIQSIQQSLVRNNTFMKQGSSTDMLLEHPEENDQTAKQKPAFQPSQNSSMQMLLEREAEKAKQRSANRSSSHSKKEDSAGGYKNMLQVKKNRYIIGIVLVLVVIGGIIAGALVATTSNSSNGTSSSGNSRLTNGTNGGGIPDPNISSFSSSSSSIDTTSTSLDRGPGSVDQSTNSQPNLISSSQPTSSTTSASVSAMAAALIWSNSLQSVYTRAGGPITSGPTLRVTDFQGNGLSGYGATVNVFSASGCSSNSLITSKQSSTDSFGIVNLDVMNITTVGTYYISVDASQLKSVCVKTIVYNAAASSITFIDSPFGIVSVGSTFPIVPTLAVLDKWGNPVVNGNVTLQSFTDSTCSIVGRGMLSFLTVSLDTKGIATFPDLSYNKSEVVFLLASSGK